MTHAPIGSLLDKTTSRSNREQKHFPAYLNNIRACPCLICGGQAEAAHLRLSSAQYGKVNGRFDQWTNPICPDHHRLGPDAQHSMGEEIFWSRHGLDPLAIAKQLWEARDNLQEMQAICQAVLARK